MLPKIHYDREALQLLGVPGARLATGLRQLEVSEATIQDLLRHDLGLDDRAISEALAAATRLADEEAPDRRAPDSPMRAPGPAEPPSP